MKIKRETADFLVVCLLLLVIVLVVIDVQRIRSEGGKCLREPLSYGIKQWEDKNNQGLTCTCTFDDGQQMFVSTNNSRFLSIKDLDNNQFSDLKDKINFTK